VPEVPSGMSFSTRPASTLSRASNRRPRLTKTCDVALSFGHESLHPACCGIARRRCVTASTTKPTACASQPSS
jgi:hypothetical protein